MISESRIAKSETLSVKAYYLAEAGIQDMIWKIKNDPTWKANFENNNNFSGQFTRNNKPLDESSYTVSIQNSDYARGEIIATAYINFGESQAKRVVKTQIFKASGSNPLGNNAIYSNQELEFNFSSVTINNGSIFTSDDIDINFSNITVEDTASAEGDIEISWFSSLSVATKMAQNYPPAPTPLEMISIDFDSADSQSWKNRADNVYTQQQFNAMLNNDHNLTITGITYVTGNIHIPKQRHLTVNGVLITDGHIYVGTNSSPGWSSIKARLTINHTTNEPAGIFSKRRILFGPWSEDVNINGLIYSLDEIILLNSNNWQNTGAVIARRVTFWSSATITQNQTIINDTLSVSSFSPTVTIEHWEEEY